MLNNAGEVEPVSVGNSSPPLVDDENPPLSNIGGRVTGVLKCYSIRYGYGFVIQDGTTDCLLVPSSGITSDISELDMSVEWPVEFDVVEGPRGSEASGLVMLNSWPNDTTEEPCGSNGASEKAVTDLFDFVNESSPEPLLEPDENVAEEIKIGDAGSEGDEVEVVSENASRANRSGKECGITARIKWFNCKRWHGALIREDDSNEQIFVRLSDEAIDLIKKRGTLVLESHQRVSVDIDWASRPSLEPQQVEVANDVTNNNESNGAKKIPPFLCTDLRLLDDSAKGDLRKDLNAKFKTREATTSKSANGTKPSNALSISQGEGGLTARQIRRRREKERKRERERVGGDANAAAENPAKKLASGDNVVKSGANLPAALASGTWRSKQPQVNTATAGPTKPLYCGASTVAKRMPVHQRFPLQPHPPPATSMGYSNRAVIGNGGMPPYGRPFPDSMLSNRRGRSPPPRPLAPTLPLPHHSLPPATAFGSYYGDGRSGGGSDMNRLMPQMPFSSRPLLGPNARFDGAISHRNVSPSRYGSVSLGSSGSLSYGQQQQQQFGHGAQQSSHMQIPAPPLSLFDGGIGASVNHRVNPYQHREMMAPDHFRSHGGSIPQAPLMSASQSTAGASAPWRYFDPRASAAMTGSTAAAASMRFPSSAAVSRRF